MVDSNDRDRVVDARNDLHRILNEVPKRFSPSIDISCSSLISYLLHRNSGQGGMIEKWIS